MPANLTITKSYDFDAAHRLDRLPPSHKCHNLHGHTYRVDIEVAGPLDDRLEWVCDYAEIDRAWAHLHGVLDHRLLNAIPGLEVPTTEILVQWVAIRLRPMLPAGVQLVAVTVHESARTRARCSFAGVA